MSNGKNKQKGNAIANGNAYVRKEIRVIIGRKHHDKLTTCLGCSTGLWLLVIVGGILSTKTPMIIFL